MKDATVAEDNARWVREKIADRGLTHVIAQEVYERLSPGVSTLSQKLLLYLMVMDTTREMAHE